MPNSERPKVTQTSLESVPNQGTVAKRSLHHLCPGIVGILQFPGQCKDSAPSFSDDDL